MEPMKIVRHQNPVPVCDIGDLKGDIKSWFSAPPEEVWTEKPVIPLCLLKCNPWIALDEFGIEWKPFAQMVQYNCPFVDGNRFYLFIPSHLFVMDTKPWMDRLGDVFIIGGKQFLGDSDWHRHFLNDDFEENKEFPLSGVQNVMMGHGYYSEYQLGNGHSGKKPAVVALENGDYLGGMVWVWYNK